MNTEMKNILINQFGFLDDGKIDAKLIEITPEMAKIMLNATRGNRAIKASSVNSLVDAAESGGFEVTGNTISFSPTFYLGDGHHRLKAIARQSKTVEQLVSINITESALKVTDKNVTRSLSDSINMYPEYDLGFVSTPKIIAISNLAFYLAGQERLKNQKNEEWMFKYKDALIFTINNFKANKTNLSSAWIKLGVLSAINYGIDKNLMTDFCDILKRGSIASSKELSNAPLFMREVLTDGRLDSYFITNGLNIKSTSGGVISRVQVLLIQMMISDFAKNKDVKRLPRIVTRNEDLSFTIPEFIYPIPKL